MVLHAACCALLKVQLEEVRPDADAVISLRRDNDTLARIIADQVAESQCGVCYESQRPSAPAPDAYSYVHLL